MSEQQEPKVTSPDDGQSASTGGLEPGWCSCDPTECQGDWLKRCRWHAMQFVPGQFAAMRKEIERLSKIEAAASIITRQTNAESAYALHDALIAAIDVSNLQT